MDLGLKGRRALVLGGSRGIGYYTAMELMREGCSVAICSRHGDELERSAEALRSMGDGMVFAQVADLMDGDSTRSFIGAAIGALGGLDILIHNASAFDLTGDEAGWERSFQLDIMAGVRAVEEALPALEASGVGSITFIGSMASKFYFGRRSSYGPAKAAMNAWANELGQSLGPKKVRANVISPGAVWMPGGRWDQRKAQMPEFFEKVEKQHPFGRMGTGEEIARIVAFVASPAALWINATHIAADGGQVAAVA